MLRQGRGGDTVEPVDFLEEGLRRRKRELLGVLRIVTQQVCRARVASIMSWPVPIMGKWRSQIARGSPAAFHEESGFDCFFGGLRTALVNHNAFACGGGQVRGGWRGDCN